MTLTSPKMSLATLKQGVNEPGDTGADPTLLPPWLDLPKFNRGREFFKEHFISILLAMYCSLVSGLAVTNLLDPLVFTGRSDTPAKSFKRYLSTFKHVVRWHLGNVWDPSDSAFQSVQSVRSMHGQVRQSLLQVRNGGQTWVSQFDMALAQCGFMGAVVLYPSEFGIHCTEHDLDDYIHFWRGIGHLLGMDDRYNICSGNYRQTHEICRQIESEIVREALKKTPNNFEKMVDAFIVGSNTPLPFTLFTTSSVLGWITLTWDSDCAFKNTLTIMDRVRIFVFRSFCFILKRVRWFDRCINAWFVGKWYAFLKIPNPSNN